MSSREIRLNLFSYTTLVHAFAGSVGSITAMTVFYPLDTVRSRLQLEDRDSKSTWLLIEELVRNEGIDTLYRGIIPVLKCLWVSNFVYFYTFHGLKLLSGNRKAQNAGSDLFLATVAGVVNVLTTTPLWVVSTRLKMKGIKNHPQFAYRGLIDGLLKIKKEEGIHKLWSSVIPSLLLVSNPAVQFMAYEAMKRQLQKLYPEREFGAFSFFIVGALSKALATVVTYPIQLIQAKQRHGHGYPDLKKDAGTKEMAMYILSKHGISGLFKGMEAKIIQTVLTAALMFATYEKISQTVFKWSLPSKTGGLIILVYFQALLYRIIEKFSLPRERVIFLFNLWLYGQQYSCCLHGLRKFGTIHLTGGIDSPAAFSPQLKFCEKLLRQPCSSVSSSWLENLVIRHEIIVNLSVADSLNSYVFINSAVMVEYFEKLLQLFTDDKAP